MASASLPPSEPRVCMAPTHPWTERGLRLVCAALMATCLLLLLTFGYGRDQSIYAMVGRVVLDGGMPYRDAWDFKPPGVFLIYALSRALFGSGPWGIRLLEALGLVGSAWLMVRLSRIWWDDSRAGWLGAALGILAHVQLDFWHTAQPESFGGMLTLAALLIASRGTASAWVTAGAIFGFTGLLKPPLAGGALILALALGLGAKGSPSAIGFQASVQLQGRAWQRHPWAIKVRPFLGPLLWLGLGGALPLLACLAWFGARGALKDLYQVLFVFTPHYSKLGWEDQSIPGMIYFGFTEWLTGYSAPLTLGVLLLLGFGPTRGQRWGAGLLAGIIAMHLAGVVLQGKFFAYHYGATWPLTAMLAGLGFSKGWDSLARLGRPGPFLFATALGLSVPLQTASKFVPGTFFERSEQRIKLALSPRGPERSKGFDALASVADVSATENGAVASFLRAHVSDSGSVFVYGFEPVIYDLAERKLASRFLYDVPQRVAWSAGSMREQLMDDLRASQPEAVVVERADVFPWVTGNSKDSEADLQTFAELRALLDSEFEEAAPIGDFRIFLRTKAPAH